ncbi:LOW QUALITY PROTEIN: hypothetical protein PHMEG_0008090 [Phytophthora megakarya]|uniref:Uncharacterized protein n=1 Tax=Phytophthora megakarya TaxID=4795 RepID=A0A225WM23_9STRA|nr:LOW QUALITY PROTEIN: hypothetical protein PHMEG_0008090 [Phytophthora megakarya]
MRCPFRCYLRYRPKKYTWLTTSLWQTAIPYSISNQRFMSARSESLIRRRRANHHRPDNSRPVFSCEYLRQGPHRPSQYLHITIRCDAVAPETLRPRQTYPHAEAKLQLVTSLPRLDTSVHTANPVTSLAVAWEMIMCWSLTPPRPLAGLDH